MFRKERPRALQRHRRAGVPIVNGDGHVAEALRGARSPRDLPQGNATSIFICPARIAGIFNSEALGQSPEIILCESILDALTFVRHGMEAATCIYGTQGFTDESFEAIKAANLDAVRLAYDADDSRREAAAEARRRATARPLVSSVYRDQAFPLRPGRQRLCLVGRRQGDALQKAVKRRAVARRRKRSRACTRAPSSISC